MRKKHIDKKNEERTEEQDELKRTSAYSDTRANYFDEKKGVYVYVKMSGDKRLPDTKITYRLGEEFTDPEGNTYVIDKELIITLDGMDHTEDNGDAEELRHRDKVFDDQRKKHEDPDETEDKDMDPWNEVAAPNTDPFSLLYEEEAPVDEKVQKVLDFMETLTPKQRDLIYDRLGSWKYLADIRREEEARTGKEVSQQAISNRWDKIITRGCKYFGVEKPRKRKIQ